MLISTCDQTLRIIIFISEDPCCLIRKSFVPLKDSLLTYPTLIDKAFSVLSDEEKADYKVVDEKTCGKLLKKIIKEGVRACASFLSHVNNSEYRDLQMLFHPPRKFVILNYHLFYNITYYLLYDKLEQNKEKTISNNLFIDYYQVMCFIQIIRLCVAFNSLKFNFEFT